MNSILILHLVGAISMPLPWLSRYACYSQSTVAQKLGLSIGVLVLTDHKQSEMSQKIRVIIWTFRERAISSPGATPGCD